MNTTCQVEENINETYNQANWLREFAKGNPRADPILFCRLQRALDLLSPASSPLGSALGLPLTFGLVLSNLLVKFVSSKSQRSHVKMILSQGFKPIPSPGGKP